MANPRALWPAQTSSPPTTTWAILEISRCPPRRLAHTTWAHWIHTLAGDALYPTTRRQTHGCFPRRRSVESPAGDNLPCTLTSPCTLIGPCTLAKPCTLMFGCALVLYSSLSSSHHILIRDSRRVTCHHPYKVNLHGCSTRIANCANNLPPRLGCAQKRRA